MRIGVLFHRPEILDSGWAKKIMNSLSEYGEVIPKICGTMGVLSTFDNYMDEKISCDFRQTSICLKDMIKQCNLLVFAFYSNNALKSHAFCWHIIKKLKKSNIPIVEIEAKNKIMINWCGESELNSILSKKLGFKLIPPIDFGKTEEVQNDVKIRTILAVEKGDHVLIDGIMVGKAVSEKVILRECNGRVTGGEGIEFKDHGLEKLTRKGKIDLFSSKINTTDHLRRTPYQIRFLEKFGKKDRILFIDHGIMINHNLNIYEEIKNGICGAVSIGDDTTSIAGDILSRFEIPIIGIVDGDKEGLIENASIHKESLILEVKHDDSFGELIYNQIFKRKKYLNMNFKEIKDTIISFTRSYNS